MAKVSVKRNTASARVGQGGLATIVSAANVLRGVLSQRSAPAITVVHATQRQVIASVMKAGLVLLAKRARAPLRQDHTAVAMGSATRRRGSVLVAPTTGVVHVRGRSAKYSTPHAAALERASPTVSLRVTANASQEVPAMHASTAPVQLKTAVAMASVTFVMASATVSRTGSGQAAAM